MASWHLQICIGFAELFWLFGESPNRLHTTGFACVDGFCCILKDLESILMHYFQLHILVYRGCLRAHCGMAGHSAAFLSESFPLETLASLAPVRDGRHKAREILKVTDEDYEIIAAVAVGYHGRTGDLPEELAAAESPNGRKPHGQVCREGSFGG